MNGLDEIAGQAAVQVDPSRPEEIADALVRVLGDSDLRARMSEFGLERSQRFTWDKCARETLSILEALQEQPADL